MYKATASDFTQVISLSQQLNEVDCPPFPSWLSEPLFIQGHYGRAHIGTHTHPASKLKNCMFLPAQLNQDQIR